jgi:GH43 family beta-xylosidase
MKINRMKNRGVSIIVFFLFCIPSICFSQKESTFSNPLLPSGADPFSFYKDGFYYYTHTNQDKIVLWKTRNLSDLANAEKKIIFTPPAGTMYSKELWAPEIHFIDGKWYAYFAADDGNNNHHRLYVLQNDNEDPMNGNWEFKGKIADTDDKWAIDGDVFKYNEDLYMIWAGWQGDENKQQDIYIAKMKDPLTIEGQRVRISVPGYDWEKHGDLNDPNNPPHVDVNEGPQFLKHKKKIFIVYSASGCWTDHYALGMLTFTGKGNLLDSSAWKKSATPVFQQSPENGVYAPGHNSFFKSPNGKEDWILYHANSAPGQGCGRNRSPRAQRFTWNKDGSPDFGKPLKAGSGIMAPGE